MAAVALSELLGATVRDGSGRIQGRIREIAVVPQDHPTRVVYVIVRTAAGDRMVPSGAVKTYTPTVRTDSVAAAWEPLIASDGVLHLKRDLLDQQIIDVHGRKVVRVNDVELEASPIDGQIALDVRSVDVGARGAVRRLAKGVVPSFTLRALLEKIPPRVIPWQYVDLIEADAARRVKLKIAYEGLSKMHPADIADIVEDLAPAEQKAVFEALDEEVAAEALAEIDPDVQVSIVESLDSGRAADIVEEMDPGKAADLLGDLPEDRSGEILKVMEPEERDEVTHLLEFGEHTAAGRMTTEFIAVPDNATVADAIGALRAFEGGQEAVSTIYLIDANRRLSGQVPLVKIAISSPTAPLVILSEPYNACAPDTPENQVVELFDKYNLSTLAVADEDGRLAGIITADDVIAILRHAK
jgi:magnesium transporter